MIRYMDFYAASVVAGTEKALANRVDSALVSLNGSAVAANGVTGIAGHTSNDGYVVLYLNGVPIISIGAEVLNAQEDFVVLDITLSPGDVLGVSHKSPSNTGAVAVTLRYTSK